MAITKLIKGKDVWFDTTEANVTPETLIEGTIALNNNGELITGIGTAGLETCTVTFDSVTHAGSCLYNAGSDLYFIGSQPNTLNKATWASWNNYVLLNGETYSINDSPVSCSASSVSFKVAKNSIIFLVEPDSGEASPKYNSGYASGECTELCINQNVYAAYFISGDTTINLCAS
jgi:hypothetical protein